MTGLKELADAFAAQHPGVTIQIRQDEGLASFSMRFAVGVDFALLDKQLVVAEDPELMVWEAFKMRAHQVSERALECMGEWKELS